jgi:RNA polymerase sigma-70 factor (ECF subfamily)
MAAHDDAEAFRQLFHFFYPRLERFARTKLQGDWDIEDALSDFFLMLWSKREKLLEANNPQGYIFIAARNHFFNCMRKQQRQPVVVNFAELNEDLPCHLSSPEGLFCRHELGEQLSLAVESLPPQCQRIFRLVRIEGLSYKQAAAELNISIKNVESQLCIARRKLQDRLTGTWHTYMTGKAG